MHYWERLLFILGVKDFIEHVVYLRWTLIVKFLILMNKLGQLMIKLTFLLDLANAFYFLFLKL